MIPPPSSILTVVVQVWNHPWSLKLDEQRKLEKAERAALYGLSDDDEEEEEEDNTLGGFIVSGSDDESISSKSTGSITNKRTRTLNNVSCTFVSLSMSHLFPCIITCRTMAAVHPLAPTGVLSLVSPPPYHVLVVVVMALLSFPAVMRPSIIVLLSRWRGNLVVMVVVVMMMW